MSEQPVLVLDRVSKRFRRGEIYDSLRDLIPALTARLFTRDRDQLAEREFWAVRDVSLEIKRGEAFGIIGSNGAGKSTLLKLLSGVMTPTSGNIAVNGVLSALIEVGAGFHPDLTGRENIFLNGTILGMSKAEIRGKFDEIVEFSGLAEFIDTPVKRYSSGMYARLGFSVAAHVEPDLLIVDEVLSVGDFMFQKKCMERMRAIITGGATVVFVSHNLRAVADLCGRSLLMERGTARMIGPSTEVIQSYLDRAYAAEHDTDRKDVFISRVSIRGRDGEQVNFESGDRAWLDIEITARRRCDMVAVVIDAKDDNYYEVFNTSSTRLGHEPISLEAGERFQTTYELDLAFASGTFHFGAFLYRYDRQREYDRWAPARTIFVSSGRDVRGAVNLNPRVVTHRRLSPAEATESFA